MFKRGLLRSSESCYKSGRPEMDGGNKIIQPLISVGSVAEWTSRGQPSSCVWDFFKFWVNEQKSRRWDLNTVQIPVQVDSDRFSTVWLYLGMNAGVDQEKNKKLNSQFVDTTKRV